MDYTFSGATENLLTNGFIFAAEINWKYKRDQSDQLYKIFINPVNFTVAAISSIRTNQIMNTQMYFNWKPDGPDELSSLKANSSEWYPKDTKVFYDSSDGAKVFDYDAVSFQCVKSKHFELVIEHYSLCSQFGTFLPWGYDSVFSLLAPYESGKFTYNFPQERVDCCESDLKKYLLQWIIRKRRSMDKDLSIERLRVIIDSLRLNPESFGFRQF
jgi:hypothetical protein